MIQYINPASNNLLSDSQNTICSRVMDLFEEGKQRISVILQASFPSINITGDAWTLPNYPGVFGIVSHFKFEDESLWGLFLSLSEQERLYPENNQARFVLNKLVCYNICNQFGHFVIGYSSTNDKLRGFISVDLKEEKISYNAS